MRFIAYVGVSILLLSACSAIPTIVDEDGVTIRGPIAFNPSYAVQGTKTAYSKDDVAKIKIYLKNTTDAGSEFSAGSLTPTDNAGVHTFPQLQVSNLKANKLYKLRLEALNSSDAAISDPAASTCTTDVDTRVAGRPGVAKEVVAGPFALKLADSSYVGNAKAAIAVTSGGLADGVATNANPSVVFPN